jgi:hypothetical protein
MPRPSHAAAIGAAILMAACTDSTGIDAPSFMLASVEGTIEAEYTGTGSFMILPPGTPGPLFTLASHGTGDSQNQGFAFQATAVPAAGDYDIGELGEGTVQATYWYDDGNTRKIFRADSGTLRLDESTARRVSSRLEGRVAGSFQATAGLLYVCDLQGAFPGGLLVCDPANEPATIEVTGSFGAGPMGGGRPGLMLSTLLHPGRAVAHGDHAATRSRPQPHPLPA